MPASQTELVERFRALHEGPGFLMPNAWDGLSAAIFARAGFSATATSSAALAFSLGRPDGRHRVSAIEHLDHARVLAQASGLPVNGDFEDGYGADPAGVGETVRAAVDAGLAGIGIEDTSADPDQPIRDFDDAVARVRGAVRAAGGAIVVTGRTDNYIHGRADLDDTVRRLCAFAEVGVDVLYAPLLPDMAAIRTVVAAVAPKPVNVLIGPSSGAVSADALFTAGVRRISIGSAGYMQAMARVTELAGQLADGELAATAGGLSFADALELIG